MLKTEHDLESKLRAKLALGTLDTEYVSIHPVLRHARRRLAARNLATFSLARIWLALACLLAPALTNRTRRRYR